MRKLTSTRGIAPKDPKHRAQVGAGLVGIVAFLCSVTECGSLSDGPALHHVHDLFRDLVYGVVGGAHRNFVSE